jgi:hypothetical protein
MNTFTIDSTAIDASAPVVPPHFQAQHARAAQNADIVAWATRVVERIRAESAKGGLRVPQWIDLTKDDAKARAAYDSMLSEPMVMTPLRVLVDSVAAQDLQVLPDDPEDERQQEEAEFVRWAFKNVEGGRLAMLRAVAFNGLRRGWSVTEPVWTEPLPPAHKYALRRTWAIWKDRDDKDIEPLVDSFRNLIGLRSKRTGEKLEPTDFVIYTHMKLFGNPLGISALRTAYNDYIGKMMAMQLWGLNLEKWGSPFLKGTYVDEATQKGSLEAALSAVEANSWISVPTGTTIEAISAATGTPANYQAYLDRCDKGMAIAIMASHLPIMEGSNQTVAGSTKEQRGTTELFQWALSEEMSNLLTRAVAILLAVNSADVPPPTVILGSVSEAEIAAMLANDNLLHGMGLSLSKRSLYARSSREAPRDAEDTLAPPTAPATGPFGFAEEPTGPAEQQVALPGKDGRQAESLLDKAKAEGINRLGKSVAPR